MKRNVTIHDIAKKLNITASTVSRALNHHPKISEKTKQKVLHIANELGYQPNSIASSLRTGKTKTIGMVVPRINRNFIANIIAGAEKLLQQHGYNLIICQSEENYEQEVKAINTLMHSKVSGILISISSQTKTSEHLYKVILKNIPLVQFDRVIKSISTPCVVNDNYNAAYNATLYLIRKGYRKIHLFSGPLYVNIYNERYNGFKNALLENNIIYTDELVHEGVITRETGYEKAMQLLVRKDKPDAILATSDYSALGTLLAAQHLKLNVPNDLGIIGFANEPFTDLTTPTLTTVEQHAQQMGITASKILLNQINQFEKNYTPSQTVIPADLIVRQSTNI